jgi:hypothetical protein
VIGLLLKHKNKEITLKALSSFLKENAILRPEIISEIFKQCQGFTYRNLSGFYPSLCF